VLWYFNVDLTGSFCCDFEFSCLLLRWGRFWERQSPPLLKITKNKSK